MDDDADDRGRSLLDPTPFPPTEPLAENVDHSVDVGDASAEVDHTVEFGGDVPVRRAEFVPWCSRCRRSPSNTFSYCS